MSSEDDSEDISDIAVELSEVLASKPEDKFVCAGSRRTDEATGKKWCNYRASRRWYGLCPGCGRYFACLAVSKGKNSSRRVTLDQETLDKVADHVFYPTGIAALDKVLGGGIVRGQTCIIGAPRGAGKTTMTLQACDGYAQDGRKSYFASGEMPRDMVISYAKRLGIANKNIALFGDPSGIDVDDLFEDVLAFGASFLVIDSIQLVSVSDVKGDLGQVTMMDAATNMITSFCQKKKVASMLIGHFAKSGDFAGSEKMQHLVDGLLRMDIKYVQDSQGVPKDIGVREILVDGKLRQAKATVTALVEMAEENGRIQEPSMRAIRQLTGLHIV